MARLALVKNRCFYPLITLTKETLAILIVGIVIIGWEGRHQITFSIIWDPFMLNYDITDIADPCQNPPMVLDLLLV